MKTDKAAAVAQECDEAADFYVDKPGAAGPETDIDLYRTIARLARIVEAQQKTIDHLSPKAPSRMETK